MDVVSDQLVNGNRIRILTNVDTFTRECLAAFVGARLRAENVMQTLTHICSKWAKPNCIHYDNGSEFAGQMTDLWAYLNKVKLAFSRPGKPTDYENLDLGGQFIL